MVAWQAVVTSLIDGLQWGSLIFLVASGLTLMVGLMRVANLAQGSYFMVGGYVGLTVLRSTGSFPLAVVAGTIAGGLLAFVTERFCLRPLYGPRVIEGVLLTFAIMMVLGDISLFLWTGVPVLVPAPSIFNFSVKIAGWDYPFYRIVIILIGVIVFAVLWWLQERTRWGAIVRAGVDDREMVTGLGINILVVFTAVFTVGGVLAGFGGTVGAPILGLYIWLGSDILMLALAVVIVGGIGSVTGCVITSFLLGIIDSLGTLLWPDLSAFTIYLILAIVLLVKPTGLFGRVER